MGYSLTLLYSIARPPHLLAHSCLTPSTSSAMAMRKTLLPEIGLLVIDELGAEEDSQIEWENAHHIRALANCALTCKDWLHRSRINLYDLAFLDSQDLL